MTIQCSTKWPKKMGDIHKQFTRFPERIIRSLPYPEYKLLTCFDFLAEQQPERDWLNVTEFQDLQAKPHTIRADKGNRWHAGRDIHFKIWEGAPYHSDAFQFAPVIKCTGVQKIEIIYSDYELCEQYCSEPVVKIDDRPLTLGEMEKLAINDGFPDIHEFCLWFNKDFKGKLIHWTDLRY